MTADVLFGPVVDLGPAAVNMRGYRGDTFATRLTFRHTDGTPVVLAGTWRAQIRAEPSDAVELDHFDVDVTEQAAGVIMVALSAAQTLALPERTVWDLENIGTTSVRTWLNGTLHLGGDVTR
jgi:hypothetical protein